MSKQMIEDVREYAWAHRKSVSQVIRDLIYELEDDPHLFSNGHDPLTIPTATLTVYVPDSIWEPAKEKLREEGVNFSAAARIYVNGLLVRGMR